MKNVKFFLLPLIVLLCLFSFSPFAHAATQIEKDITETTVWTKENSPYVIKKGINVNATLTIKEGTIIKFNYKSSAKLDVNNELNAIGTENEPIIFTSIRDDSFGGDTNNDGDLTKPAPGDWAYIQFKLGSKGIIEHSSILYAAPVGMVVGALSTISDDVIFRNSEIKYSGHAGFFIVNSSPIVENNIFSNNLAGILVSNSNGKVAKITNNAIMDNAGGAGVLNQLILNQLDARENWWGDKTGPYFKPYLYDLPANLDGKGNMVSNGVLFDPWLKKDPQIIRKPIVLVPGIGASINPDLMIGGALNDNWTMFDHTYDGIIESFKSMGYIEGKDLFIAYYDWRRSNTESANNFLKPMIQKALSLNPVSKVNIIAHSMGGLVARSYIQGDNYANDVDNLILIATPNKGSSDVYTAWEGGYIPKNWGNKAAINVFLAIMMLKNPSMDTYSIIHKYVPSIKELLPVFSYIKSGETLLDYLSMSEKNDFLFNLNEKENILNDRVKVSLIKGTGKKTVNNIPVIASDSNVLWKDGKPNPIDPELNDDKGDGRVLELSAQIQNVFNQTMQSNHGDIVSASEKIIAERISENLDVIYPAPDVYDEIGFWFASPIDIEITDPDGKSITKYKNEIPLAKYSGESKLDGFKMVLIPNPIKGDYEINIKGNGEGEYHIGSEYADYTGEKQDYSSIVQGEIKAGEEKEYKVAYNPENEIPVEDIKPKDTTPPIITAVATTEPNENGWYKNDVTISFVAEDNESGIEGENEKEVTISSEGENQSVTETFNDIAGNAASKTVSGINIDKTVPETVAEILGTKGKNDWFVSDVEIKFLGNDNLSGIDKIHFSLDGASFEVGYSVNISEDGEHVLKYYSDDLAGNIESEKELKIKIDKTAPEIKIISPENRKYFNNEILEIKYDVIDLNDTESQIKLDNNFLKSNKIDLFLKNLGSHNVAILANDEAGNTSEISVTFEIVTDIRAIVSNIDNCFDKGLITSRNAKYFLEIKLRHLQERMRLLDIFESKWMPQWAKERVVANIEREINKEIEGLIFQIENNKKLSEAIAPEAKALLIESLKFIKR